MNEGFASLNVEMKDDEDEDEEEDEEEEDEVEVEDEDEDDVEDEDEDVEAEAEEEEEEEWGEMVDKEVFEVGLEDGLFDVEFTTDLDWIVVSDFMVERTCFGEAASFQL